MESALVAQQRNSLQYVDPAAVAAAEAAKARIQSAYQMAIYKPRNADQSRDRILHACRRPLFAEKVEFSKPVGTKHIKGPSIRFAELALREWGNILSDVQILYEDDFVRRSRVMVLDLETNASFSKEIQINKTVERKNKSDREVLGERLNTQGEKVFIVKATEDELQNKENAAISKAVRNEGLRVIPTDIVDEAMDTAKETLRDRDKKDPDAAKKKVLDSFSEIGVKPKDIQKYLGHSTDTLNPKELADLRGIYRAIKDGEAVWIDYITDDPKDKKPPTNPGNDGVAGAGDGHVNTFDDTIPEGTDMMMLSDYLKDVAKANKIPVEKVKEAAAKEPEDFWKMFPAWCERQTKKKDKEEKKKAPGSELTDRCAAECPIELEKGRKVYQPRSVCEQCESKEGCPAL